MKFFTAFVLCFAVVSADVLDDVLDIEQDRAYQQTGGVTMVLDKFVNMIQQGMRNLGAVKASADKELNTFIGKQAEAKARLDGAIKGQHKAQKTRDIEYGEMKAAARDLATLEETASKEKALLNVIISKVNELEKVSAKKDKKKVMPRRKPFKPVAMIEESENQDLWSEITNELARAHPQIPKLRALIKSLIARIDGQVAGARAQLKKATAEHKAAEAELKKRKFHRAIRAEEHKRYVGYSEVALANKRNADEAYERTKQWALKLLNVISHIRKTIHHLTNIGNTKPTEVKCYKEHGKGYCKAKLATELITIETGKSKAAPKKPASIPEMLKMLLDSIRAEINAERVQMKNTITALKKQLDSNTANYQRAIKEQAKAKAGVKRSTAAYRKSVAAYKEAKNLYETEKAMRASESKLVKQIIGLVTSLKSVGKGKQCLPKETMSALQTMVDVERDIGCNPSKILDLLKNFSAQIAQQGAAQKADMIKKHKIMKVMSARLEKAKAAYSMRVAQAKATRKVLEASRLDWQKTVEFNDQEEALRVQELKTVDKIEHLIFKVMFPMGNHDAGLKQKKITEKAVRKLPKA